MAGVIEVKWHFANNLSSMTNCGRNVEFDVLSDGFVASSKLYGAELLYCPTCHLFWLTNPIMWLKYLLGRSPLLSIEIVRWHLVPKCWKRVWNSVSLEARPMWISVLQSTKMLNFQGISRIRANKITGPTWGASLLASGPLQCRYL